MYKNQLSSILDLRFLKLGKSKVLEKQKQAQVIMTIRSQKKKLTLHKQMRQRDSLIEYYQQSQINQSLHLKLLNSKVCKLIKSKLSPLMTPIKRVRKQKKQTCLSDLSSSGSFLPKIFLNRIDKNELNVKIKAKVFRESDPMNANQLSFTDDPKSINKKALDHVRTRRKMLRSLDSVIQSQKQKKEPSILQRCIQIFERQIQKTKQQNKIEKTTIKTLAPQLLQNISQNSLFLTESQINLKNKTLKRQILEDIKKQIGQARSLTIRINNNHKKIISKS